MQRLIGAVEIAMAIFGGTASAIATTTPTINLHPGHGTTLNFRRSGETVQRVWLDDPSQVTLDFDDVNCRMSDQPCAAKVIHLRRIQRLKFNGLPATATTLLTVLTDKNIHQFQLAFPAAGKPSSTIININAQPRTLHAQ